MPSTRRQHLGQAGVAIAGAALSLLASSGAAATLPDEVRRAVAALRAANRDVRKGALDVVAWQALVEDVLATTPLEELVAAIDLSSLVRGFRYPADRAGMTRVRLPGRDGRRVRAAVFGLRAARAIPPHAHNNVVAAHLILDGELRVRTFQRRADTDAGLVIEPVRDVVLGRGDVLSVSDDEENVHWLVGLSERAHTLDVPLQRVRPAKEYATRAAAGGMIFVDVERGEPDGARLRVPVLDPGKAIARYGRRKENFARATVRAKRDRRVVVTVDDLPWVGPRSRSVDDNLARLTHTLRDRGVPAHGFVCGKRGELGALRRWLDAGFGLGDHTFSHGAYSKQTPEALLRDVERNAAAVKEALGHRLSDDGWFRLPFLDHGHTPDKVRRLSQWLRESDRRLAHVSLDTVDYLFAKAYVSSTSRDAVAELYVQHVAECAAHFEELSRRLYGREIPLVLLLHANELNCERVGAVLDALAARGYRFVSLEDAYVDGVYRTYRHRPPLVELRGDRNLLTQVAHARGLEVQDRSGRAWFDARYRPRLPPARDVSP